MKISDILERSEHDFSSLTNAELGRLTKEFIERCAGVRPDYDPEYDDFDERWTGPDSAMLYGAAMDLIVGDTPNTVNSSWGSGTYRGTPNDERLHNSLVSEINIRSRQ